MTEFSIGLILPQIYLLVFGLLALVVGLWSAKDGWLWHSVTPAVMAVVGLILAIYAQIAGVMLVLPKLKPLAITQFSNALTIDASGVIFGVLACIGTLVVVVMCLDYYRQQPRNQGEFYFLLLYACCAVTLAAYAADFITIYLTIEFLSISSYILVGFDKGNARSIEAAIKYFLFGGACSAAMLYGMTLLFGMTGTLNLAELGEKLLVGGYPAPALWIALIFVLVGITFKLAAVPVHLWAPDVYEGAPTPVTAFLSVVSKAAGLVVLLRFVWTSMGPSVDWVGLMVGVSAASMTLGNLAAIPQRDMKRMLAYSSIAQAGYFLIGFAALGTNLIDSRSLAVQGIFIYLLGYLPANLGAFACVAVVERLTGSSGIEAFRGMIRRSPLIAIALVVFFLSLAGIPPTLGFAGKFWLFAAAIKSRYVMLWWLAVIGVANSVISVYYYFNVARVMFFDGSTEPLKVRFGLASSSVIWVCAVASVLLLLLMQPLGRLAAENSWMFFTPR